MRTSFKLIYAATIFIVIAVIALIYIFIPANLFVNVTVKINSNTAATSRTINTNQWRNAFYRHTDSSFSMNQYNYTVVKRLYNAADIKISNGADQYNAHITLIQLSADSCIMQWIIKAASGTNPVTKISAYTKAVALKKNIETAIKQLQPFLQKSENIYGFAITHTTLTDTFLVSVKKQYKSLPSISDIYTMVAHLKNYIKTQGAIETNYPMLNITYTNSSFATMVGIPTNRQLPEQADIYPKRLSPIKDKILTATVTGGPATVKQAYEQIELYMRDHSLSAPVIPFEQMITDRSKEKDSSKWVTKIFYPII